MIQKNNLKILFVEDVPSDVDLAVLELRKQKLKFDHITVCTREDLLTALRDFIPDLIISDYMMPAFNGLQALKVAKDYNLDIPFILYTGSVNEEIAVECIKEGAQDYVIKEHLTRLPFAVKEALEQVRINREKRASELLLRDNEEKLQSIFSAAPVGIGLKVNEIIIEVNDYFCQMTGYSRGELIGEPFSLFFPMQEEVIDKFNQESGFISPIGSESIETIFRCKNGTHLNVVFNTAPLDKNDGSKGITFTVLDISERTKTDSDLKEAHKLINTLVSNLQGLVYRCKNDKQFTMEFLSEGAKELTGYSPVELLHSQHISYLDLIYPDDRDYVWNEVQKAIGRKKHYEITYRITTRSGEIRWVWEKGEGIFLKNGELEFLEGFITDITDRKKTELALRKSEEKYRGIFENVQDVYYETSLEGKILEVSPSINILSKGMYNMSELIGRSMDEFYSEAGERESIIKQLNDTGSVSDFEVTLKNRDGLVTPCSLSAKLIFSSDGKPEKIIGSMRDITVRRNASDALKLAKEKAETSDKLKTDFLNNISHEVRTPLNGILGFAEIISLKDLSEDERKDSMTMLLESSNRLLNTITNYMDISLITSGSLSINNKDFTPSQILKKLYNNFDPVCKNRNLKLVLDTPEKPDDFLLHSDPEICQKILSHFLDNAIKFTEKGTISFGFRNNTDKLEFHVRDTGIGIGNESFITIFDRFAKENAGQYKVSEGSGLGLSISKGMSEAIGARIRLESEPGAGSTFFLDIPLKKLNTGTLSVNAKSELVKAMAGSKILVAEDDDTNFFYLNALLVRETQATILHASNGIEAINHFKNNPDIKLILMDIKMPEMDGFEATRQIRLLSSRVPIIAITAYAMSGDEDRILAAGCDSYLSKPINRKSLFEKIEEYMKIEKS